MENKKTSGYGILSMMAMTIGIVIGSGIFVKNSGLIGTNGSILLTLISWLLGSLIIIAMVIAFFEIISITEITGEQSTMSNWGRHLYGIRFGKVIGYYFSFVYFPIIMASLFLFSGNQFSQTIEAAKGVSDVDTYNHMIVSIGFGAIFAITIMILNSVTRKPGKYFQNVGVIIKIIPIVFIIVLLFVMLIMGNVHFPTKEEIAGEGIPTKTLNPVLLIFMTMPSILFVFDGFILAGSLSKEANSKNTFRISFVASMLIIIVIYIMFSISIFGLGNPAEEHGEYGTITNSIYSVFNLQAAEIIAPIVSGIIVISILNGVSGIAISSTRTLSDLSENNFIKDENKELTIKNKAGVSTMSGLFMFFTTFMWFVLIAVFDSYVSSKTGNLFVIVNFISNLIVIGAFILYAIIIFGAILNRFTNRVEVKRNILFLPAAIFALISISIITGYFTFLLFFPANGLPDSLPAAHWSELVIFVIFIIYTSLVTIFHMAQTRKLNMEIHKENI